MAIEKLFESFVQAGRFLKNWSPKTERSYRQAFSSFQQSQREAQTADTSASASNLTKAQLETWVVGMRQDGRTPGGCNVYIRGMNSFCSWLREEGHIPAPLKLKLLKVPTTTLRGFSDAEIRTLLAFRAKGFFAVRTWTLIQTLLDTGIRIEEALTLRTLQLNLEALTMTVVGKGDKTRTVPFSLELRKVLFRYLQDKDKRDINRTYVFCAKNGHRISYRNAYRDLAKLCAAMRITGEHVHPHALRHAFACSYIRQGGNIYKLSRILGHSSISTTTIYLRSMGVEQYGEEHSRLTPLNQIHTTGR